MTRICITGAQGFIGRHLVRRLGEAGYPLTLAVRPGADAVVRAPQVEAVDVGDIAPDTDWRRALEGCRVVVHLAGQTPGPGVTEARYRLVNDAGTARLAAQCVDAGVDVLIFLSSSFAVADNACAVVIDDAMESRATTPYGRSKIAAEAHVAAFTAAGRTGVSLRPPLVYGATAKGNWHLLQRLAASGLPLPFGAVQNRRSVIAVGNLCDAIAAAVSGAQQTPGRGGSFAVADAAPASLSDMLRWLRAGMGLPPRLLPVPAASISAALGLLGRKAAADSLLGHHEIDASRFCTVYGWAPPESTEAAMRRSGAGFLAARNHPVRPAV